MPVTDDVRPTGAATEPRGSDPRAAEPRATPEFDRSPPQDVAAEQCVLGGMLLSKDAIADVVEVLRAGDFYRPNHSVIFEAVLDLYGRGEPADPITVAAALADSGELARVGGAGYLHTLIASVPTAANAAYYAKIVAERAVLRRLVEAGTRIVQLGYGAAAGAGRDVDDVVDLAQQTVYDVTERRVSEDFAVLAEMLQPTLDEIEAVGAQGGVMTGVPTGFTDLDRLLNGLHSGQLIVVAGRPGLGKALALDTPLATPGGWTTMGEVRVGDQLLAADGRPTTVIALSEVMLGQHCHQVVFSDGCAIVADAGHRWLTHTWPARRDGASPTVRTTGEIASTVLGGAAGGRLNHSILNSGPLDLPPAQLPLPAYTLGAWLGAGHRGGARLTRIDPEIAAHIVADGLGVRRNRRYAYTLRLRAADGQLPVTGDAGQPPVACGTDRPCAGSGTDRSCADCGEPVARPRVSARCHRCHRVRGSVGRILRTIGVLADRHIPAAYLRASQPQRRALLAGLLDSRATLTPAGEIRLAVTSARLAGDVRELIESLGYTCRVTLRVPRGRHAASPVGYTLSFFAPDEVFRLDHKRSAHKERRCTGPTVRSGLRYIVAVHPVPTVPVRCVTVDHPSHLYLAGPSMIPTHNSTAAMDFARCASVRHNLASAVFSLEMSKVEIVMRLLSAEARVPLHVLRSGQLSDDDWTKLARRMGEISEAPLFVDDTPNMNLMEIRAKSRRLKQRHDLKLIVVDYLQLMTSPKRVESRQQEVAELSRGLKLLAKEVQCPVVAVSQLNRGPEQRNDKRPQLSDLRESGCLTADTTLLRADTGAPITFRALIDKGYRDVLLWSLDARRRLVAAPLVNVFPSGVKDVFRMTLTSGRVVEASGNHEFLTAGGWVPLNTLSPGDDIAVPRRVPPPLAAGLGWSEHRLGLLAHLIATGRVRTGQPTRCASRHPANLAFVERAAGAEFGVVARRIRRGRRQQTCLQPPSRTSQAPISRWFDDLGIADLRYDEKRLPDALYAAADPEIRLFLYHLWSTRGPVPVPTGRGRTAARICYPTPSRALADGVVHLLTRLGIACRVQAIRSTGCGGPRYHVVVGDCRAFREKIGAVGVIGGRAGALAAHSGGESGATVDSGTDDVRWDSIVAIVPVGAQPVYDATVKENHNFIANGVVAHNSIEQDADVVILLHRDDYYDKESPRAGEADFIVAKHRNGPTDTVTVAAQLHLSRFVDMAI